MTVDWNLTTRLANGVPVAAVQRADGTFAVPDVLRGYAGLAPALDDWAALEPRLRAADVTEAPSLEASEPSPTIAFPRKLLGAGANYQDHVQEMGAPPAPTGATSFFFFIPPTTAMIGDTQDVLIPADPRFAVDWEAELAVVIGRRARDVAEADALEYVAGYACYNDISARGLMRQEHPLAPPFTWDWAAAKGMDTFAPMGPMAPAWMVPNPNALTIRCSVNGVVKQDSSTTEFISSVQQLISTASALWTLEPGDVIATGTPAGVGHPHGEHLSAGDLVRVDIGDLAPLTNHVVLRPDAALEPHAAERPQPNEQLILNGARP